MAYNYLIKVTKSLGGRTNALTSSNTYNIESQSRIGEGNLRGTIDQIVQAEKAAHYDNVHFLRATLTERVQTPLHQTQGKFISKEIEGAGLRVLGAKLLLPENFCLGVKRDAVDGRSGTLYYRWCLAQDDVTLGTDHSYVLANRATFDTGNLNDNTLVGILNQPLPDGTFVMPNAPRNALDVNRAIESYRLAGVLFKQPYNNRKTVEQAMGDAGERRVYALQKEIVDLLRGVLFTALSPLHQGAILRAMDEIRDTLDAMTPKRAMRVALDAALKALPGGEALG